MVDYSGLVRQSPPTRSGGARHRRKASANGLGLLAPEEFRRERSQASDPPTLRTIYRWMDRGMLAWVQWGEIDVAATRGLLLARVRRPERERRISASVASRTSSVASA
jgi:hypothetical protein